MLNLIFPASFLNLIRKLIEDYEELRDRSEPDPIPHPSLKPQRYEFLSKQFWDKYDRPYLGPKRIRDAEFYRSRRVSKAVRKLPKSLPF